MKIKITGQELALVNRFTPLADKTINAVPIECEFSSMWDSFDSKVLQIKQGENTYNVVLENNVGFLPAEITVGSCDIGIFAYNAIGSRLTTTVCNVLIQKSGFMSGEDTPIPPTPDLYSQLLGEINTAETTTEGYKNAAALSSNTAAEQAQISTAKAAVATTQANAASLNKDVTDVNAVKTDSAAVQAASSAATASAERNAAEQAAQRAEAAATGFPMRYYRNSVAAMEEITTAKQGDLCYVTDYVNKSSDLYVYDTTDMDSDNVNPEWVLLGHLRFSDLSRDELLSILQLAPVATSGSYTDLTDKPKRYEQFAVLNPVDNVITWDYSVTDKIKVTLSAGANIVINNLYNGAVGLIECYSGQLILPEGAVKALDFDYAVAGVNQHYLYTFMYDGTVQHWTRTVCG